MARATGMAIAIAATPATKVATAASDAGSDGASAVEQGTHALSGGRRGAEPEDHAAGDHRERLLAEQDANIQRLCAERHPDADFAPPMRRDIGQPSSFPATVSSPAEDGGKRRMFRWE